MQKTIPYTKWSPARNTTLFFPLAAAEEMGREAAGQLAARAMLPHNLSAEQVGFVDTETKKLDMAGGEFCVNATRAFGAHLHRLAGTAERTMTHTVTVSGWPDPIRVTSRGREPVWQVAAELSLSSCTVRKVQEGMHVVTLPGISHVLLDETNNSFPDFSGTDMEAFHKTMRSKLGLEHEACVGIIWYRGKENLSITPIVHVRATGTTVPENSCGSGSLALALIRPEEKLDLGQPSGAVLTIRRSASDRAVVSGGVTLVAEGTLWLEALP